MRIGLLKSDHVNGDLILKHGDLSDMFAGMFFKDYPGDIDVFDVCAGEFPDFTYTCDVFIISGSRHSVNDSMSWIENLKSFIRVRAAKGDAIIGFCFGHQLIASAFGGQVGSNINGWNVGLRPLSLFKMAEWMTPYKSRLNLLFNHREQVLRPPPEAEILAGDSSCHIQMMSIGTAVIGIQAHPEYQIPYQEALMGVSSTLPKLMYIDALARNTHLHCDSDILCEWLMNFIDGQRSAQKGTQ